MPFTHVPNWLSAMQDGKEEKLNEALMPDALHPNALGMEKVLSCLDSHLLPYLPNLLKL